MRYKKKKGYICQMYFNLVSSLKNLPVSYCDGCGEDFEAIAIQEKVAYGRLELRKEGNGPVEEALYVCQSCCVVYNNLTKSDETFKPEKVRKQPKRTKHHGKRKKR